MPQVHQILTLVQVLALQVVILTVARRRRRQAPVVVVLVHCSLKPLDWQIDLVSDLFILLFSVGRYCLGQ